MPRKIRSNKRRAGLDEDAQAWLAGKPCGTFGIFKPFADRLELWETYGDPNVATWDKRHCTFPEPIETED
jgi:hypothetical protein